MIQIKSMNIETVLSTTKHLISAQHTIYLEDW